MTNKLWKLTTFAILGLLAGTVLGALLAVSFHFQNPLRHTPSTGEGRIRSFTCTDAALSARILYAEYDGPLGEEWICTRDGWVRLTTTGIVP